MNFYNPITITFFILFSLSIIIKILLDIANYKYRKKNSKKVPDELAGLIDEEKLELINKYSNAKLLFSIVRYIIDKIILVLILILAIIPRYYMTFLNGKSNNVYFSAASFFFIILLLKILYSLPFSFIFNFVIEKKYGFNKMSIPLWIADIIKEFIIGVILGGIILFALIFFLYTPLFKNIWWLLLWGFFVLFSLLLQIIYPTIIAPLFNKFKPLEDNELKTDIEKLVEKVGLKSSGVFEMDASKRSTHSNAYFTGIGKTKRIVLYDSLLKKHTKEEILSILAHELGHYKYKHIIKGTILSFITSLILLFLAYLFIDNRMLYNAFGFVNSISIETIKFIGILLLSILAGPIFFLTFPIGPILSRRHEYQADKFSKELIGTVEPLINALKKLTIDNLSNIYPSPIYAWFYYSHPPLFKRIRALKNE